MSRFPLPVIAVMLAFLLAAAAQAKGERGGIALGWLAPADGVRQLSGGPAPGTLARRIAPLVPDTVSDAEAVALGAAFNADLLSRRRARRIDEVQAAIAPPGPRVGVSGLRDLIASVEAGRHGYDAIHHSASTLPNRPPTDLTLAEIRAWIAATPGQQHAIGRYQFIPKTLDNLIARLDLSPDARFTPGLQDRLADELLADAGLAAFRAGRLDRTGFMHNLATIWAGLPTASGKSHYHGLAGNAAGMSWTDYDRRVAALFAE